MTWRTFISLATSALSRSTIRVSFKRITWSSFFFFLFFCAKRLLQTIWPSFTFITISSLSAERSAGHFFNFLFRLQLTSSQSISIYSSEQGIFFPYLIIIFLAFPKAVLTVLEKTCYSKVPIFLSSTFYRED